MTMQVNITREQYENNFETFLQYGDIKNSRYVFMGLEEGAGDMPIDKNIEARLAWRESIKDSIRYLDDSNDIKLGYYINDSIVADLARKRHVNSNYSVKDLRTAVGNSPTMLFQTRLRMVLENNFQYLKDNPEKGLNVKQKEALKGKMLEETKDYFINNLHKEGNKSAMIDYYPLPSNKADAWYYKSIFNTRKDYEKYINDKNSTRRLLIKKLYDTYPMNVSIVYAGKSAEKGLEVFYEDLGFNIKDAEIVNIDQIHESFKWLIEHEVIKPEFKSIKQLKISRRVRQDGKIQWLFITPFFGNGQISYYGIYNIATWIAAKLKDSNL